MSGSLTPDAGGSSSPLSDGIDELAWLRLTSAVSAVSNRDIAALRMCLNMPPLASQVPAAEFGAFAIVGLGVTVDRPDEQLREMRPIVAAWWQRNLAMIPERLHLKSD